jgi:hypothetical protein
VILLEELERAWKEEHRVVEAMKELSDLWKSWKIQKKQHA